MLASPRLGAAIRGVLWGCLAGALWAAVEILVNRSAGSVAPARLIEEVALLDVGIAAGVGLVLQLLMPQLDPIRLGVGLAFAYAFVRMIELPGVKGELAMLPVVVVAAAIAGRIADRGGRAFAGFVQLVVLGAAAVLLWDVFRDMSHVNASKRLMSPLLVIGPLLGVITLDRLLALAVAQRGRRIALEAIAGGIALAVFGTPLDPSPLVEPAVTAVPPPAGTPDVILVSWDTTRVDRLSAYGYDRETTPRLAEFAHDARRYADARSTAGWTLPGHASMLTGLFPHQHGARLSGSFLGTESIDGRANVAYPLAASHVTMAEMLRDRGYSTGGFVGNYAYLYRDYGIGQGFGTYDDAPGALVRVRPPTLRLAQQVVPGFWTKTYRPASEVNARALAWLDGVPRDRPVFMFINYMDAHHPWYAQPPYDRWVRGLKGWRSVATRNLYTHAPKPPLADAAAYMSASYDGQLAYTDHAFGELLDALRARGRYEHALIIMTADHGELLGEHGTMGHMGRMLYEQLLRIPLVVKYPDAARPRDVVEHPVQLVNILPTVAAVSGAAVPAEVQARPLDAEPTGPVLAEEWVNPWLVQEYGATYDRTIQVIIEGPYKLIATSRGQQMLFDVEHDPGETRDLAAEQPDRVARLSRYVDNLGPLHVARSD